ncbi:RDD family protein [Cellulomonas alba]|uniref:RDD family protein n=1 Tax=Cellulomonas alba TaxID=3053467 RepID=A0ABT7SBT5_9CELL|nr:RDD family protein [Cellulomonas alba]MDM7853644.1 RDD family protein [Cellulomonas alba]
MVTRENIGSWLEGSPAGGEGDDRGARLGLPRDGSGSLAGLGRRIVALLIDWFASLLVASVVFPHDSASRSWGPLAIFALENVVLVGSIGSSIGHRLLGLRVRRVATPPAEPVVDDGHAPGFLAAAIRTVLVCVVIPAVIWDGDGRGMHDRAAGTAIVRR